MGFKENLKSELAYKGLLVKELSAQSGISHHTINNYLSTNNCIPTAENALKMAQVLEVSVEYLLTGQEAKPIKLPLSPDIRIVAETMNTLDDLDRQIIVNLTLALKQKKEVQK
ncbi:transcriptional regulator [Spirochaetia bacterium]|nr:transcriptional regulator [Spirochaetia bacterium]